MIRSDSTALVTGASSGIGREFCVRLAPLCKRVIAVARSGDELQQLADELRADCELVIVQADLAALEGIAQCVESIRQKGPVDILVNNAGFGAFTPFASCSIDDQVDMISLHVVATTRLCRAALPFMLEQGAGQIINVSSVGAFVPLANNAVYSATKSYLHQFTCALAQEVFSQGVVVQSLCPGYTHTGIHDTPTMSDFDSSRIPDELWMSPADVVEESLANLGEDILCMPGEINRAMVKKVLHKQMETFEV